MTEIKNDNTDIGMNDILISDDGVELKKIKQRLASQRYRAKKKEEDLLAFNTKNNAYQKKFYQNNKNKVLEYQRFQKKCKYYYCKNLNNLNNHSSLVV